MDMPMSDRVYASGEWHDRAANWRDQIDLATCDAMTAYAAGRDDGYRQAVTEFRAMWQFLLTMDTALDADALPAAPVVELPVRRQRHLRVVNG